MQVGEFDWDLPHECLIGLDRRVENCLYAHIVFIQRSSSVSQELQNCLLSLEERCSALFMERVCD